MPNNSDFFLFHIHFQPLIIKMTEIQLVSMYIFNTKKFKLFQCNFFLNRSAASSRESSRGRNSQLPPTVRKTPSTSRERENLIETVKELNRNLVPESKQQETKKVESHLNGKIAEPPSGKFCFFLLFC